MKTKFDFQCSLITNPTIEIKRVQIQISITSKNLHDPKNMDRI